MHERGAVSGEFGDGASHHGGCDVLVEGQPVGIGKRLATRKADLLPIGYFHVVFALPAEVAEIAYHNKAALYDLLFKAASETMLTIAADARADFDRREARGDSQGAESLLWLPPVVQEVSDPMRA